MTPGVWLTSWHPEPAGRPAVVCLPPAGAGCGQYRRWQHLLGDPVTVLGVQLPGRERRWNDPPPSDFATMIVQITDELVATVPGEVPLVLYGHSFGGLIAYEIATRLGRRHGRWPATLIVAACRPPQMWVGAGRDLLNNPDEHRRLLDARGLGPDELDADSRATLMRVLEADARLSLTFRHDGQVLDCPVESWAGKADPIVTPDDARAWQACGATVQIRTFDGGHYFVDEHLAEIIPLVRAATLAGRP